MVAYFVATRCSHSNRVNSFVNMMNTSNLNAKKLNCLSRLDIVEEKKKLYETKKALFEEKKEKHNEYLQDLESKIENSLAIIDEVEQQLVEKNQTIKELKFEVKRLQKQKELTQQKQKQCKVGHFLQQIIESSNEEFKYPKDITAKYQTLNHILKELNQKQIATQNKAIQEKSNIQDLAHEFRCTMLKLSCNIENMQDEWRSLEFQIKSKQMQLEISIKSATESQQDYQRKKLAVFNMVNIICKQMNKQLTTTNPTQQLDKIENYLKDLNAIATELATEPN